MKDCVIVIIWGNSAGWTGGCLGEGGKRGSPVRENERERRKSQYAVWVNQIQ